MKDRICYHIDLGGIGLIKESHINQYGVYWLLNANCLNYSSHPYWNDKDKIKIFKHGDLIQNIE